MSALDPRSRVLPFTQRARSISRGIHYSLDPIIEYIDQQYEEYMTAERHPGFRKAIPDTRIHAVLYFLAPNGHG